MSDTVIDLSGYRENKPKLGDGDIDVIKQALLDNPDATILRLSGNNLTDAGITQLVPLIKEHGNITNITLSYNQVGDGGAEALATITTLETLNLGGNDLTDNGVVKLATTIRPHGNIKHLDLSHNHVRDNGAVALAEIATLETLDLSGNVHGNTNNVGNRGAIALAQSTSLKQLDLSNNPLSDEGVLAFLDNRVLQKLDLDYNNRMFTKGAIEKLEETRGDNFVGGVASEYVYNTEELVLDTEYAQLKRLSEDLQASLGIEPDTLTVNTESIRIVLKGSQIQSFHESYRDQMAQRIANATSRQLASRDIANTAVISDGENGDKIITVNFAASDKPEVEKVKTQLETLIQQHSSQPINVIDEAKQVARLNSYIPKLADIFEVTGGNIARLRNNSTTAFLRVPAHITTTSEKFNQFVRTHFPGLKPGAVSLLTQEEVNQQLSPDVKDSIIRVTPGDIAQWEGANEGRFVRTLNRHEDELSQIIEKGTLPTVLPVQSVSAQNVSTTANAADGTDTSATTATTTAAPDNGANNPATTTTTTQQSDTQHTSSTTDEPEEKKTPAPEGDTWYEHLNVGMLLGPAAAGLTMLITGSTGIGGLMLAGLVGIITGFTVPGMLNKATNYFPTWKKNVDRAGAGEDETLQNDKQVRLRDIGGDDRVITKEERQAVVGIHEKKFKHLLETQFKVKADDDGNIHIPQDVDIDELFSLNPSNASAGGDQSHGHEH